MVRVEIRRFDITSLKNGKVCILIGRRGTGKTTLLIHLMFIMRNRLHSGIAMSPTADSIRTFCKFMPASFCYDDYNDDAVKRTQEAKYNIQQKRGGEDADDYNVFVIMDDCMYNKKCMKSMEMRRLFMNGRHVKVFFVNLLQYCLDIGPDLRTNIDYVFAFQDASMDNRIKLWRYFFGMFNKYEDFSKVMDACTANNECLVLDNTSKSTAIEDHVFYFKASIDIPPFRVGCRAWWWWDWRYGKPRSAASAAALIDKGVSDAYFAEHKDKDTLAKMDGAGKAEFTVIKAPKDHSILRKRVAREMAAFSGGGIRPSANLRMDLDGMNLDAFETRR